jgi:excisionase family DNA binding protein
MTSNKRANEIAALVGHLVELLTEQPETEVDKVPVAPQRTLLTVEEAAEQLGIGRTLAWQLVRSGALGSVRIGKLRRVPAVAVAEFAVQLIEQPSPRDK